jgi:hypothetical protein
MCAICVSTRLMPELLIAKDAKVRKDREEDIGTL